MTFVDLILIIILALVFITGVVIRIITGRKLKLLEGYGGRFKKGNMKGKLISKG